MKYIHKPRATEPRRIGIFFVWLLLAAASPAEDFTTSVYQPYTRLPLTWNEAIWQPGQSSPVAGNTYEVLNGGLILNPPRVGVQTFPGDSLVLDAGATIQATGPVGTSLNFPGVDRNAGLIFNGGTLLAGDDHTFRISGRIYVAADSIIDHASAGRNFVITALIEGDGNLTLVNASIRRPLEIRSSDNPYRGTWLIKSGYLRGTGNGSLGSGNIVISEGARFTVNYDIQTPGTLTLLGSNSVMFLHQDCQFGAAIINDTSLLPGAYSYDQLVARFPDNFAPGGSGSITVLPVDPSSDIDSTGAAGGVSDASSSSPDTTVSAMHLVPVSLPAPDPPGGVIVSANSTSQITIYWNDSTILSGLGLGGYDVYRDGTKIATTSATTYDDSGLSLSTQYCYTIVAFDVLGNDSAPSPQACATTQSGVDTITPWVPSGLLLLVNSASQVTLYWNASTDLGGVVAGYRVYRNGVLVGSTSSTTYSDNGLAAATQYCYSIVAYDSAGNSSSGSAPACATMPGAPTAINAPSNLTATALDANRVNLAWTDNSNNEVGFQIERAPAASGPWVVIGTGRGNATLYSDTGLSPAIDYYYRVSAFN